MGLRGEELVVVQLRGRGEREAGTVGVAVDVVRIDRVAPLADRQVHAGAHHGAHAGGARVQPALARPAVQRIAERSGGELPGVGAPVLERAGAEVADHLASSGAKRGDRRGAGVEEIDVVGARGHRRVERSLQLDLPGSSRPRLPARGRARCGGSRGRCGCYGRCDRRRGRGCSGGAAGVAGAGAAGAGGVGFAGGGGSAGAVSSGALVTRTSSSRSEASARLSVP